MVGACLGDKVAEIVYPLTVIHVIGYPIIRYCFYENCFT